MPKKKIKPPTHWSFRVAECFGPLAIRLLHRTIRTRFVPADIVPDLHRGGLPVIYAFWHGRMLIPAYTHRGQGISIMVSEHGDGEYIARVVERMGFRAIRGSTTRGGAKALVQLCKAGRDGRDLAFTPDGPRGPRYTVQRGVIYAAQRTGFPIVPAGIEPSRWWQVGSWDEFKIPKPFCRCVIALGDPLYVPADVPEEGLEEYRRRLEVEMRRLSDVALSVARNGA